MLQVRILRDSRMIKKALPQTSEKGSGLQRKLTMRTSGHVPREDSPKPVPFLLYSVNIATLAVSVPQTGDKQEVNLRMYHILSDGVSTPCFGVASEANLE
ncbi:hypothetical protein EIP91_003570 [Steccherinum ochraceum]|uniref:Uncharacterized protein n=1 Tax=Steccherinum ochraceum TaxID=92696 RepID=A0A4R0RDN5_9APHY|nr:hypothetical protein EIP91_003570 [Steccherinum ochraceum]